MRMEPTGLDEGCQLFRVRKLPILPGTPTVAQLSYR